MKYNNEPVYDEKIAPLMAQIIAICKEEKLPMVAQFYLQDEREDDGRPMYCSTVLKWARIYAAVIPRGDIYEVIPDGNIENDPDCLKDGLSYQCDSATIKRVLEISVRG